MIDFIQQLAGFLCHQDPAVMATYKDGMTLLCPRCTGLHTGFTAGVLLGLGIGGLRPGEFERHHYMLLLALIFIPLFHWLALKASLIEPTLSQRLITGLIGGSAFSVLVINRILQTISLLDVYPFHKDKRREITLLATIFVFAISTFTGFLFLYFSVAQSLNVLLSVFIPLNILILLLLISTIIMQQFRTLRTTHSGDLYEQ